MACVRKPAGSEYWFLHYVERASGVKRIRKTDPPTSSKKIAIEQLNLILAGMGPKRSHGPIRIEAVMEHYRGHLLAKAASTAKAQKSWIDWWIKNYGRLQAAEFGNAEMNAAIQLLKAKKDGRHKDPKKANLITEGTIGEYLNLMRAAIRRAVKDEIIISHPLVLYEIEFRSQVREVVYTPEQEQKIKQTMSQMKMVWLRRLFELMIAQGLRIGDAIVRRREDFNDETGLLTFTQEKTRRRKGMTTVVPITDATRAVLETLPAAGLLFPSKYKMNAGKPRDQRNAQLRFQAAVELAGIGNHTPHDCRRTFTMRLHEEDVDDETKAFLLGHSNTKSLERYRWTSRSRGIAKAREALDRIRMRSEPNVVSMKKPRHRRSA